MRFRFALLVCVVPAVAAAQTPEIDAAVKDRLATIKYVQSLRDPASGAYKVTPDGKPSLRAVNGAVKALHYLGAKVPEPEKTTAFVLSCRTESGFADSPGGEATPLTTAIGIMAATELGIPLKEVHSTMIGLAHAKTLEEARMAAAATESWVKAYEWKTAVASPEPWLKMAKKELKPDGTAGNGNGVARDTASIAAMFLRLGRKIDGQDKVIEVLKAGQREDGGWGKEKKMGSDLESTYRVMRAMHLLKEKPKDVIALQKFLTSCRNADGGYGVTPGAPSTMSGVYYASIVTKWLDEMGKK